MLRTGNAACEHSLSTRLCTPRVAAGRRQRETVGTVWLTAQTPFCQSHELTSGRASVDLPAITHLASAASLPGTILLCTYLAVRALVILVALFGKKDRAERALAVLPVLRGHRRPDENGP
jgi:hypothetical protein